MYKYSQMQISLSRSRILRQLLRTKVTCSLDMPSNPNSVGKNLEILPLYSQVLLNGNKICIHDNSGQYTYSVLHYNSKILSRQISNICGSQSSSTVGIFCSHNILTILITWASWMSGQKILLLDRNLPFQQLRILAKETKVRLIISSDLFEVQSKKLAHENDIPLIQVDSEFLCNDFKHEVPNNIEMLNTVFINNEAAFLYGKNVKKTTLMTQEELCAKIKKALQSWSLTKNDRILYICPSFHLYNVEFIFNLYVPLSVGSQLSMLESFDSKTAWQTILGINIPTNNRITALIAEPKVYQELIAEYEKIFAGDKQVEEHIRLYCLHNIRLMLSCFYNTDRKTLATWEKITGINLQESRLIDNINCGMEANNLRTASVSMTGNTLAENREYGIFPILHIAVIGRLMILNQDDLFLHAGEFGSYCNGFLKTIGRYYRYSSC